MDICNIRSVQNASFDLMKKKKMKKREKRRKGNKKKLNRTASGVRPARIK